MEMFLGGLQELLTVGNFLAMNVGVLFGIIFGAIPGLSANLAIILILPVTYTMTPIGAMSLLLGIYGGQYGGSISAILLGVPGTNQSAATLLDGYPMAKNGQAQKALLMALYASTIGGLVSSVILLFAAPAMAKLALLVAPPEYFVLSIFGLSIIAGVSGKSMFKGMIAGCIGVLISMVGLDAQSGVFRFGFGNVNFLKGLGLLPVLLGAFALPNLLDMIFSKSYENQFVNQFEVDLTQKVTKEEMKKSMPGILRSSIIGSLIGAMPGTGAAIASFLSYNDAKNSSKNPELFGTGVIEGVAAPEAANNAVSATSFIPLFTMGIPGSVVAATLVGALSMHGLIPGPGLFKNHGIIMYAVMIGFIFINIFMFLQGKLLAKYFAKVSKVPQTLIIPMLLVICAAGAFSISNNMFDVWVMLACGITFYIIKKLGFFGAPIVIGIILGPLAEINLSRSLVMSEGSLLIFFTRPVSLIFIILTIVYIVMTVRSNKRQSKNSQASA